MDFRELSYIAAIAKHQNITRAAEALYMSQPNLSKFLSSLEKDLGLKLFKRADKKYIPTYAGERYLEYAKNILESKASLDSELGDIIRRDIGVLSIGLPNMRCAYMLPKTLPEFNKKYPNVKINIFEGTSAMIDRKLLEGEIDLAFYSKPHELNGHIEYLTIASEELLICTRKKHPVKNFASKNKINLTALKDERFILLSPEQRTGQLARFYLKKNNISLENSVTVNNMPAVISLTEQGWGVSFIFESHLRWHMPVPEIETFSFGEDRVICNFVAAFRKNSYLSNHAREFIKIAEKLYS